MSRRRLGACLDLEIAESWRERTLHTTRSATTAKTNSYSPRLTNHWTCLGGWMDSICLRSSHSRWACTVAGLPDKATPDIAHRETETAITVRQAVALRRAL